MPWKETCAMDERNAFIDAWLSREFGVAALCRRFGISRPTGYALLQRFAQEGRAGLVERSRAPHRHPNAATQETIAAIVQLKRRHPRWGPVTIRDWLLREQPRQRWPAASTCGEILRRHGLVVPRGRRRPSTPPYTQPFATAQAPNDVWSIDFKGQFALGDARLCYPLTVSDNHSRYLLACRALRQPRHRPVRRALEQVFGEYGLPVALRSDNGPPFASIAVGGLSALAVWCLKLGVMPERIAPGRPEQNGRHERMHRTLKAATAAPPKASLSAQQRAFERFRREYNNERPHRALAGQRPAELYRPSPRSLPAKLPQMSYPDEFAVRKVRHEGHIRWRGAEVFVSKTLVGEPVGLQELDHDLWLVYFGPLDLGVLDARRGKIIRPNRKDL